MDNIYLISSSSFRLMEEEIEKIVKGNKYSTFDLNTVLLDEVLEEAAYFSDNEEMLRQCRYYLSHEKERRLIAEKGMLRCITDDYSNEGMIRKVLSIINEKK